MDEVKRKVGVRVAQVKSKKLEGLFDQGGWSWGCLLLSGGNAEEEWCYDQVLACIYMP